ncbi:uncharacterized protein LOC120194393 [Hibiscus syriacus]|uniref:uncharacterized protein LOC120194393 n=1 Tax=Hibiscus syriacus TaxID=106335 RepID=UPI0019249E5E|nr:uncharacterized protein LOC120194393 [Hibiscus syriacus]
MKMKSLMVAAAMTVLYKVQFWFLEGIAGMETTRIRYVKGLKDTEKRLQVEFRYLINGVKKSCLETGWMSSFDSLLAPTGLASARKALMAEGRSSSQRFMGLESIKHPT